MTLPIRSALSTKVAMEAFTDAKRVCSSSFSATLSRSTSVATRPGTSSEGTFRLDESAAISARSLDRYRTASSPT
ncbi:Uncharacterised protein [Mycobacteroides abscessus subsp. abscessus]|nr:Uncharacterised protein [Mycobacteroides abscessus subsp. abscessus]SHW98442.1 Uncharacterised protein [Mycobacteroides abscessus subsp. abscessus]SKL13577.1 Uncharacterised protein [Mycobacteroides abscessus subsp. abscessus]